MLDYRSMFQIFAIPTAIGNSHFVVAVSMIWSLILSLLITPISSRLFDPRDIAVEYNTSMQILDTFDETRFFAANDVAYAFDIVISAEIHGEDNISFTNSSYAFQSFKTARNYTNGKDYRNSADVTAYSASLDCQPVQNVNWTVEYATSSNIVATYVFAFNDRGCNVKIRATVGTDDSIILNTNGYLDCNLPYPDRITFVYGNGTYSPQSPGQLANDLNLLSCIPTYKLTSGTLDMTFSPEHSPRIVSFLGRNSTQLPASTTFTMDYQTWLIDLTDFDTKAVGLNTNRFGRIIYNYAQNINPQDPLNSDTALKSIQDIFSAIFAVTAKRVLLQPTSTPIVTTGTETLTSKRLFVNPSIAYILIISVALLCCWNIFLMFYRPISSLSEEPTGALYLANILHGEHVKNLVEGFRPYSEAYMGQFGKYVKTRYNIDESRARLISSPDKQAFEIYLDLTRR